MARSSAQEWKIAFQGSLAAADQSQTTINSSSVTTMSGAPKTDIQATDQNGQPATTDEVQSVTLSNASGGTFRLAFLGQTTAPIAYNASAASVESAVEALQAVDQVTVTGNAGGPWSVTFAGTHAGVNVQQLQGDAATAESGDVIRTLSFEYDVASQLTEASDPAATYTYTLDNLGRVTSETQDIAGLTPDIVLASTWDVSSNRTSLAAEIGGTDDFKNDYTYDYLNRMTQVIQQGQSGGNAVATKRVDFAYNGLGQFTTIDRYQNTGGTNIVAQTTFAYDDDNRLTDLDHKQSSTTLAGYDYGYDNMGRITSIDSFIEDVSAFTYDKTSQLTGADHTSPRADESYSYDDNGNRTMSGYTVTANNLTTSDGTYDYEYDDEGNRTKRTKISDGSYEVYDWDHRNRLVSVTFYDSTDTVLKTVDHTYDLFNRWLRRTTDPDGPGSAAAIDTFFAYDGIEPILQWDGSAASDLTNRYLFGPAVDQILASEDVTSLTSAGNTVWGLWDHLGTPRDIADQNESTYTTTVTNHRTYDSFGKLTAETNAAIDLLFGFTGKAFDDDTGLGNHLWRWLGFDLAEWLSEDPASFIGDDANLRRYVHNRSPNFIDWNGLQDAAPPYNPGDEVPNPGVKAPPTKPWIVGFPKGVKKGTISLPDGTKVPIYAVPHAEMGSITADKKLVTDQAGNFKTTADHMAISVAAKDAKLTQLYSVDYYDKTGKQAKVGEHVEDVDKKAGKEMILQGYTYIDQGKQDTEPWVPTHDYDDPAGVMFQDKPEPLKGDMVPLEWSKRIIRFKTYVDIGDSVVAVVEWEWETIWEGGKVVKGEYKNVNIITSDIKLPPEMQTDFVYGHLYGNMGFPYPVTKPNPYKPKK